MPKSDWIMGNGTKMTKFLERERRLLYIFYWPVSSFQAEQCRFCRTRPSRQKQQNGKHFQPARKESDEKAELAVGGCRSKVSWSWTNHFIKVKRKSEQKLEKKYAKIIRLSLFAKLCISKYQIKVILCIRMAKLE